MSSRTIPRAPAVTLGRAALVSAAVVAVLALAACAAPGRGGGADGASAPAPGASEQDGARQAVTLITRRQLARMLETKDFLLVNTHIPYEGELPRTDVFIPYDDVSRYLDKLPADKGAKIVLYCRSDRMSGIAARELARLGYTNLYDLDGGFEAWKAEGYELLRKESR